MGLTIAMGTPAGGAAGGGNPLGFLVTMTLVMGIFYFMMIRPQQRKDKERRSTIAAIKSGDRVLFGGGIIGVVTNVKDDVLVIRIADKVKIEALRSAVAQVLEKGDKPVADEDGKSNA